MANQVRDAVRSHASQGLVSGFAARATTAAGACDYCRVTSAFQAWHSVDLPASFIWRSVSPIGTLSPGASALSLNW